MTFTDIIFAVGAGIVGVLGGMFVLKQGQVNEEELRIKGEKLLIRAKEQSAEMIAEAGKKVVERKKQFEEEEAEFVAQIDRTSKALETKIASQQMKDAKIAELKKAIQEEENSIAVLRSSTGEVGEKAIDQLCRSIGISRDHVREEAIKRYELECKEDAETRIQMAVTWAEDSATRDGRNILADAVYRFAEATSVEHVQNTLTVSRDEFKGRIVGRGGRTIAFFEELFGVDVIFNDEPEIIIISCFNLVQQEIARTAMERLMRERVINEEVIRRIKTIAEQDVAKVLLRDGTKALNILGLKDMPQDFAKLVGRLRFRTSYGQNVMRHCFEVGYFARLLASEVRADTNTAWLGGFFHDIGKAIDQETGGSHDVLSKEILEKYGFSWEIVHAAWTHHFAIPQETIEAKIVQAADAISASRPGARAESMERYLEKIKDLQETALSFAGAKKAYAINAGREVRVVVDPAAVSDEGAQKLAADIAAKVQEKGGYPGKIKIMTVRVTKATDYAK